MVDRSVSLSRMLSRRAQLTSEPSRGACVARLIQKEAEHFARSIGATWVGVRSGRTAARPFVAAAVDEPLLEHHASVDIDAKGATIGMSAGDLATLHLGSKAAERAGLSDDLIGIAGMHGAVPIGMEYDGRNNAPAASGRRRVAELMRRGRAL